MTPLFYLMTMPSYDIYTFLLVCCCNIHTLLIIILHVVLYCSTYNIFITPYLATIYIYPQLSINFPYVSFVLSDTLMIVHSHTHTQHLVASFTLYNVGCIGWWALGGTCCLGGGGGVGRISWQAGCRGGWGLSHTLI